MKIESLDVQRLYGLYNYHIDFNPDLTLIHGNNGCGKTTVLNIIEAIISGRIYNLFSWDFERIRLKYYSDAGEHDKHTVLIAYDEDNLRVTQNGTNRTIKKEDYYRQSEDADSPFELFLNMRSRYPFLNEIKNEFNYVYLPLNRSSTVNSDRRPYSRFPWEMRYSDALAFSGLRPFGRDPEVEDAARLVQEKYAEASAQVSAVNDDFRNRILKSLLDTNLDFSDDSFFEFILGAAPSDDLDDTKAQYLRLLESLDLLDDGERAKYNERFANYVIQLQEFRDSLSREEQFQGLASLMRTYYEIEKMKTVIPLAEEMERDKSLAMSRIRLFVSTMNSFLTNQGGDKELVIDETGQIKFQTVGSKRRVTVAHLSSGEKQLLVFFASFIFRVEDGESSIFVVDEPELSLHLSWQRMFVEKAMGINRDMQLIFATHAPEIVGKYRDKMYELKKTVSEDSELQHD